MQRMFCVDAMRYKLRQLSTLAITSTLVLSALAPVLFFGQASAAQITERKITMSTSQRAATGVSYAVSFKPATSITATGMVVEFCANSPLVGSSCTAPANGNTLEGFVGNTGSVSGSWVIDGTSDANTLILTHSGATLTAGSTFTVTVSGVTNPTYDSVQPATFYARILTYTGSPTGYTSTSPGSYTDQGGIALTTNNQLQVDARVQEELEFCVGTVDNTVISNATTPANCSAAPFSSATPTVDIGTISSTTTSISPIAVSSGGNNMNGAAMIRTNAVNGATITYFAEQETGSGRLKVAGATCTGSSGFDAGSGVTDQCFGSSSTQGDFSTAGEKFGMTSSDVFRPTGSTTTNLTRDASYDGDGTAASGFAWQQDGTTTTLATSSTVMDYEMLLLRFAARTSATTPTGSYSVTSTYVATSTY